MRSYSTTFKTRQEKSKRILWSKRELWPHEYAQLILKGQLTLADVPVPFQNWVQHYLNQANYAEERLLVKKAAQIVLIKSLFGRRQALARVSKEYRWKVQYYVERIFAQRKK